METVYLGSVISCDGKGGGELSRRIGEAQRAFDGLHHAWPHAGKGEHLHELRGQQTSLLFGDSLAPEA